MIEFKAPATIKKGIEDFLGTEQSREHIQKAWDKISTLMASGEQVEHLLIQKQLTSFKLFPGALVLTDRRVMCMTGGPFKMSFLDMFWRNLADAHLVESMTGATMAFQDTAGAVLSMDCLPKELARKAYAYAQGIEELAIEFRRQRAMEESRAAARGTFITPERYPEQPISQAPAIAVSPAPADPVEALGTLKRLLDQGLIEEAEYQQKKADILSRL